MTSSSSAAELLTDMKALGITVQALGGAIRYRPLSTMTPALMARLQGHKAEVLRLLDTDAVIADVRQSVERLWKDMVWRPTWERRFKAATYADFTSLRSVLNVAIDLAEGHHRRHDWSAFDSTCKYLHRLAIGAEWDKAKPITEADR